MKYKLSVVLLVPAATTLCFRCCHHRDDPPTSKRIDRRVVDAEVQFSLRLFDKLLAQNPKENIVISPVGLFQNLSMLHSGADGSSRAALDKVLGIGGLSVDELDQANRDMRDNVTNPATRIEMPDATSLSINKNTMLNKSFMSRSRKYYALRIGETALARPNTALGRKVAEDKEAVSLSDKVAFDGEWSRPFRADSKTARFRQAGGLDKHVPTIKQIMKAKLHHDRDFSSVRIPYGKGGVSMYVLMPHHVASMQAIRRKLDPEAWKRLMSSYNHPYAISTRLPKFTLKYDSKQEIKRALSAMGANVIFSRREADFSRCLASPSGKSTAMYIREIRHEATIRFEEGGSRSSDFPFLGSLQSVFLDPYRYWIDRPFVFVIRDDRTGAILLMGAVFDPSQAEQMDIRRTMVDTTARRFQCPI